MKLLYVFPHPDDESFGPAATIHRQLDQGHEVYLLTLTRGGADRRRLQLGLSVEEMGEIRYRELLRVKEALGLTGLTVFDYPDGALREAERGRLEADIEAHIETIRPNVVVTYPDHGIDGHPDHLATHEAVRRVYGALTRRGADYLRRLAFYTQLSEGFDSGRGFRLTSSAKDRSTACLPFGRRISKR